MCAMKAISDILSECLEDELDTLEEKQLSGELDSLIARASKGILEELFNIGIDDETLLLSIAEKLHEECLILTYGNLTAIDADIKDWADFVLTSPENENISNKVH